MEGPDGGVYAKTLKSGRVKIRAYRNDGDTIREAELAVQAAKVFDAVFREMTGSGVTLQGVHILDDHPDSPSPDSVPEREV